MESRYTLRAMAYTHGITHTAATSAYWATQSYFEDTLVTVSDPAALSCNSITTVLTRTTPAGTREDVATTTHHIAKVVGGGLYSALTAAEYSGIETLLDTMWTNLMLRRAASWTVSEYAWHEKRADHGTTENGSEAVGPAVRRTTKALVGNVSNSRLPDQNALTMSIRTASRKHWGRMYLPGFDSGHYDLAMGRPSNASVDSDAAAFHTYVAGLTSASCTLGVWTFKYKAFLDISELRMDNVPDIIRRRRPKQASYSKSYTS